MKIARFKFRREIDYGIVVGNRLVPKSVLEKICNSDLPDDVIGFISDPTVPKLVEQRVSPAELSDRSLSLREVKLLPPISNPPKIVCLGLNYVDHAAEQRLRPPTEPVIFLKPRTAIIGPYDDIVYPSIVTKLDYEGELAVVIGEKAKKVQSSRAMEHVFGFMVFNDVSARDIQFRDKQWTRGKSFDTFAPTGPWIVSKKQVGDYDNLKIVTRVNGEARQDSSTSLMYLKVPEIVSSISHVMTLESGDMIATGTPSGVGFAIKPRPKFLSMGDIIEIEIQGIGAIRNKVVSEASSP